MRNANIEIRKMDKDNKNKKYDLEERTFQFAKNIRDFVGKLKNSISNNEYRKQLVRSSGSIGANYIEANESLGNRDFLMRIKISRKEAKESRYRLKLLDISEKNLEQERDKLLTEAHELMLIFGAIIKKTSNK